MGKLKVGGRISLKAILRIAFQLATFALLASRDVEGFFHIQKFTTTTESSPQRITTTIRNNDRIIRLHSSTRLSSKKEEEEEEDELSGRGKSMPLVLSRSSSKYSTIPPWLKRNEYNTSPDVVENLVEMLTISLIEHEFTDGDIADLIKAIYLVSAGDVQILVGSVEFCKLILRLEEPGENYNLLVSKDIILASILHYSECVTARQDGIYQKVEKALGYMDPPGGLEREDQQLILSGSSSSSDSDDSYFTDDDDKGTTETNINDEEIFPESSVSLRRKLSNNSPGKRAADIFSLDALRLAQEASKIKRAEILADVILTDRRVLTETEYGDISNLLLSVTRDWRALAIRCVANLYRLEGSLWDTPMGTGEFLPRNAATTLSARYSMRVYANLSKRLGLHRLQTQLEGSAFRILYPRQFSAVSTLFQEKGAAMKRVAAFLSSDITRILNEDQFLIDQLETCEIQARVKEPYSFWKKIVKKRRKGQNGVSLLSPAGQLSILDILDGVALRVIIKAANTWESIENGDIDATERMLVYYVHHLIRSQYPPTSPDRVKDYIKNPKPNGYQSLHHTSSIGYNDQDIPFEVQVRSEKMHKIAEFGIAAHWGYKANNMFLLPSSSASASKQQQPDLEEASDSKLKGSSSSDGNNSDSAYITALETARESLVRSNVYVFLAGSISDLEGGHLLSLPVGSLVLDIFAELGRKFDIETDEGGFQVWRNGQLAMPNEIVGNGDVVLFQKISSGVKNGKDIKEMSSAS